MSSHFCPAYPKPRRSRASTLLMFFSARRSWMDALYERSYSMQMGEVHIPGLDMYMVNEPALVRRVMTEQAADFPKSALLGDALEPLLGESIFTTNGAQWRRQRQMMDPAFAQARMKVAFPVMREATQDLLARLRALPDGTEQDVEVEMTHVTADIIFRTIFSVPMEGRDAHRVFAAFARYQALAPRLMLPSLFKLRWLVWPWDLWRSRRAAAEIRGLLEQLVRPRYEACRAGQAHPHPDILAAFLDARDPQTGEPFGFDELVNQVAMLFLAGHETSASALTWACYLVANQPDIQERMHAEVVAHLGDRQPEFTDMKQLTLTWNVFREALRLFPPVGFFAREAARGCPMRDKQVPQGAVVVVSPWLIQRHRQWWPEPDAFNPDRYDNDESRESLKQAYLPFGMGPRVCMGAAFALQEAALILSSVVRHFRLEAVPGHVPQPVGRLTIRSANGVRLVLHRREAA
ncbi:MAG: cytochrome P450 [Ramlibacter sp.]